MLPLDECRLYRKWKSEKGIDIIPILRGLFQRRWLIGKVTGVAVLIGLLYSLLLPAQYTSTATLMPEYNAASSGGGRASQLLQQYGGMLDIDGGTYASNSNAIRVELYPDIVQSLPFQVGLLKHEYHFPQHDTTASLITYLTKLNEPFWANIYESSDTGMSSIVGQKFSNSNRKAVDSEVDLKWTDVDIMNLSETQVELVKYLQQRTSATLEQESATLKIQATMPNARLSAAVAQQIIQQLRGYLKEYRKEKLKIDLKYLRNQYDQVQKRLYSLRDSLAAFQDRNTNLISASAQIKEQNLQNKVDRASSLYKGLARQLEQTEMRMDEDTPVFQILQPVQVPLAKSSPNTLLILIISMFLGLGGGAGFVLVRKWGSGFAWKDGKSGTQKR